MNILLINCSPVRNGATAEIVKTVHSFLDSAHKIHSICIDDYDIHYCKGCRSCHQTAACFQDDDMLKVIEAFEWADRIVCVSPSYWADVPGQFKAFIDRCTPWCNTHEPHARLSAGKKGYAIGSEHAGMPQNYWQHRALLRAHGDHSQRKSGTLFDRAQRGCRWQKTGN